MGRIRETVAIAKISIGKKGLPAADVDMKSLITNSYNVTAV
jgi:hypothetical protein